MARRTATVRIVSEAKLRALLGARPGLPRVVAGGNFATPWQALATLDAAVAEYRLFMLNAQAGVPDRDGVTLESPFVGPGMRGRERLRYFPGRLSLIPVMLAGPLPPDVVLVQTSAPAGGTVSLGTEVNALPAAIAAARSHPKADTSTVVPRLAGPVTSFQHSFIVSDQGTAAIWGHDAAAQAEQIITQVAHPSVRDGLREAGRELGFRV
jgi:acyl-CoA hydrolase